jgi:hypothetical protein
MRGAMFNRILHIMVSTALIILIAFPVLILSVNGTDVFAAASEEDKIKLGERIYREGILPSGEPMKAIVMGDIPVDGRMFTCDDCHQRSGLGSVEGTVITWPTNGRELYKPRRRTGAWKPPDKDKGMRLKRRELPAYWQVKDERPAYTDKKLAKMLMSGVDPAGRKLDPIMPRYLLNKRNMDVLVNYLKNLSNEFSPGVDNATIRFATVITDEVPLEDQTAMLSVLQAHIDSRNSQYRHQERRVKSGPFYKTEKHQAYRRLSLSVWKLKGPEETWTSQLERYYWEEPVFGLLGGITTGSWKPIHEFCEKNRIPSLFPLTDLPLISESDWYTLYFSKGLYQEGESAAKYLHLSKKIGPEIKVVQVFRKSRKSAALAQSFEKSWKSFKRTAPENIILSPEEKLTDKFWKNLLGTHSQTVLLLWLEAEDITNLGGLAQAKIPPQMVFLSSGLIGTDLSIVPDKVRAISYLSYPYKLPGKSTKRVEVVKRWLQARDLSFSNKEIQTRMYFLGWMLPAGIKHMRSEFFREYFMEGFDMMVDQNYAIAIYPRLSFGPGQRYASKGCYIIQLSKGPNPELIKKSEWVIH